MCRCLLAHWRNLVISSGRNPEFTFTFESWWATMKDIKDMDVNEKLMYMLKCMESQRPSLKIREKIRKAKLHVRIEMMPQEYKDELDRKLGIS